MYIQTVQTMTKIKTETEEGFKNQHRNTPEKEENNLVQNFNATICEIHMNTTSDIVNFKV